MWVRDATMERSIYCHWGSEDAHSTRIESYVDGNTIGNRGAHKTSLYGFYNAISRIRNSHLHKAVASIQWVTPAPKSKDQHMQAPEWDLQNIQFERWRLRVIGDWERGREQRKHYPSNPFHETNLIPVATLSYTFLYDRLWMINNSSPRPIYSPKTSASGVFIFVLT